MTIQVRVLSISFIFGSLVPRWEKVGSVFSMDSVNRFCVIQVVSEGERDTVGGRQTSPRTDGPLAR